MNRKFVSHSKESTRMFQSNFLEAFSKIHPLVPVLIFLPVIIYFGYTSIFIFHETFAVFLGLFIAGIFTWSLTEYLMHRFLFHYQPTSELGKRLHFVFHGIHHDYPNDAKRLVMAPSVSIPLAFLFYFLFYFLWGDQHVAGFFSGFVLGYLCYDLTHYAIHHFSFNNGVFQKLKKHHMIHHYSDEEHGYGVSSKLWDYVFRTDFKKK